MLADAKTCAAPPFSICSRRSPEGPNTVLTRRLPFADFSKAWSVETGLSEIHALKKHILQPLGRLYSDGEMKFPAFSSPLRG